MRLFVIYNEINAYASIYYYVLGRCFHSFRVHLYVHYFIYANMNFCSQINKITKCDFACQLMSAFLCRFVFVSFHIFFLFSCVRVRVQTLVANVKRASITRRILRLNGNIYISLGPLIHFRARENEEQNEWVRLKCRAHGSQFGSSLSLSHRLSADYWFPYYINSVPRVRYNVRMHTQQARENIVI